MSFWNIWQSWTPQEDLILRQGILALPHGAEQDVSIE